MKPIPEPFPSRLDADCEYVFRCLEHEDWETASEWIERVFQMAEHLSRIPPDDDENPFA